MYLLDLSWENNIVIYALVSWMVLVVISPLASSSCYQYLCNMNTDRSMLEVTVDRRMERRKNMSIVNVFVSPLRVHQLSL